MTRLFDRVAEVRVAHPTDATEGGDALYAISITGLRIGFNVDKSNSGSKRNDSKVQIYNLSAGTRAEIKTGDVVELIAGYVEHFGRIFRGTVHAVSHRKAGADVITELSLVDGPEFNIKQFADALHGDGEALINVVRHLADELKMELIANLDDLAILIQAVGGPAINGQVLTGTAQQILSQLAGTLGIEYHVQDGRLILLPPGGALEEEVVLISPLSGLIGSPELGEDKGGMLTTDPSLRPTTIKLVSLLQPTVGIGKLIQVESLSYNGTYRVVELSHEGDTHESGWYTEITAQAMEGYTVQALGLTG